MRALITGGKGRLGTALTQYARRFKNVSVTALGKDELDVRNLGQVHTAIAESDLVIHCAGVLSAVSEKDHRLAWDTNVEGTANVATCCEVHKSRLVHISTDYVFDGNEGNYAEDCPPSPVNYYGFTKAVAESIVDCTVLGSSLVLRCPFRYEGPWGYAKAFSDQWISGRVIGEVVPDIWKAALDDDLRGMLHIGGPRKNILDFARESTPEVGSCTRAEFTDFRIPMDVSLDSTRWKEFCKKL